MAEGRKQAISLRLGNGDIRRIKQLAKRLGARESDVVRFAIKMMLHRMLPLCDSTVRGRQLVPMLAEVGPEAVQHFDLDAERLDAIVNEGAADEHRMDLDDITLLTVVGAQEAYAKVSLRAMLPASNPPSSGERRNVSPVNAMRRHLYDKYGFAEHINGTRPPASGKEPAAVASVAAAALAGRSKAAR